MSGSFIFEAKVTATVVIEGSPIANTAKEAKDKFLEALNEEFEVKNFGMVEIINRVTGEVTEFE